MELGNKQRHLSDAERATIAKYLAADNRAFANRVGGAVHPRDTFYTRYVKRLFDVSIAFCVLVITLPVNAMLALATFVDVGRPLLFRQTRTGKGGIPFRLVKFRNMTNETDAQGVLLPPKERVTPWGKFVRKTSLDELLNFWSILKGDMSLIGPRPLIEKYLPRYSERHMMRHAVRPGLECPIIDESIQQLSGWNQRLENDVWYVEHVSFLLDAKMILAMVRMVFDRKQAKARGIAQRGSFMGYNENGQAIDQTEIPEAYLVRLEREKSASHPDNAADSDAAGNGNRNVGSIVTDDSSVIGDGNINGSAAGNGNRSKPPMDRPNRDSQEALLL